MKIKHKFVELIPDTLDEDVLYISITYAIVLHKCCCGCGNEVATPLSPEGWKLTFDGETVSLYPSIGNWGFPCRSHYWITRNRVEWARSWSDEEIRENREFAGKRDIYQATKSFWKPWSIFKKKKGRPRH